MFKKRVIVRDTASCLAGKEGITVAVGILDTHRCLDHDKEVVCKVLIDNMVSNWIPSRWIEVVETLPLHSTLLS